MNTLGVRVLAFYYGAERVKRPQLAWTGSQNQGWTADIYLRERRSSSPQVPVSIRIDQHLSEFRF